MTLAHPIGGTALFSACNPVHAVMPLIGNTPLLEMRFRVRDGERRIFAKYEPLNLTGSIKDRMAAYILGCAYESGAIESGWEIVEATSGNTGISFAAIGRALGNPVRIFMPDWMSRERVVLLEGFGAELVPVSRQEGGFLGSIARADEYAAAHERVFQPRQFTNPCNVEAHAYGTGPEIIAQLARAGCEPTAFVAGVGTGGTVMGVAQAMRARHPGAAIHPLEPSSAPVLSAGRKTGQHRIQGISDEFVPPIVDLGLLDRIVSVPDGDAILMAQSLSRGMGLGVGISSGANVLGALGLLDDLDQDAVVVTVLPDSNKKYLSTDLFGAEPVRREYLSPRVEPLGFRAIT